MTTPWWSNYAGLDPAALPEAVDLLARALALLLAGASRPAALSQKNRSLSVWTGSGFRPVAAAPQPAAGSSRAAMVLRKWKKNMVAVVHTARRSAAGSARNTAKHLSAKKLGQDIDERDSAG